MVGLDGPCVPPRAPPAAGVCLGAGKGVEDGPLEGEAGRCSQSVLM